MRQVHACTDEAQKDGGCDCILQPALESMSVVCVVGWTYCSKMFGCFEPWTLQCTFLNAASGDTTPARGVAMQCELCKVRSSSAASGALAETHARAVNKNHWQNSKVSSP